MDFWDRFAGLYDFAESFNDNVYRRMANLTTMLIPFGAKVLDCAAGTGELSLAAAKKAGHVICTDNSERMLAVAREKAETLGATNISFGKCDIYSINQPDNTFDTVIAGNVLHLLDDPEAALKELCRVTKPGGKILLPCFTTYGSNSKLLKLYKKIGYKGREFTPNGYCRMIANSHCGRVKAKIIPGKVPCCYAVVYKK